MLAIGLKLLTPAFPIVAAVVSGEKELSSWQGSGSKFTWNDAVAKAVEIVEATASQVDDILSIEEVVSFNIRDSSENLSVNI